jgi:hypothetical protein
VPLTFVAINQTDGKMFKTQPFKNSPSRTQNGYPISFAPSSVSVDPLRNRIFAFDSGPGNIAAVDLLPDGTFCTKWMENQTTTEFMALIGPPNRRVLVATDIPFPQLPGQNSNDSVIWRDAETGSLLAQSKQLLAVNTGTMVEPGYGGDMYYMVQPNPNNSKPYPPGSIIKLTVRPF